MILMDKRTQIVILIFIYWVLSITLPSSNTTQLKSFLHCFNCAMSDDGNVVTEKSHKINKILLLFDTLKL